MCVLSSLHFSHQNAIAATFKPRTPSTRPRNAGEGAPWRRCVVEPRGLGQWLQAADEPGVAVRVRLRDGAAEHVVVWQWQSKSRRLACIAPASCRFRGVVPGRSSGAHGPSFTPRVRHRRDPDLRAGALEAGAGAVPAAPEVWSSVEINQ